MIAVHRFVPDTLHKFPSIHILSTYIYIGVFLYVGMYF